MYILYLMHIPWGWIKQRPHFFAEMLSKDYSVDIHYKRALRAKKAHLSTTPNESSKISSFIVLPFDKIPYFQRWKVFDYINSCLLRLQLGKISKYDCIWITNISIYHYISPFIHDRQIVIYDCMDDELEFPAVKSNNVLSNKIAKAEKLLLHRANIVFCSAHYLIKKVSQRTGVDTKKFTLLNNGIQLPQKADVSFPCEICSKLDLLKSLSNTFVYIGTIAAWFDFDLLLSMLAKNPDANVVLIGPNEVRIPSHNRIHYLGTVNRQYIFSFLDAAKCLIMPFVVNELIRSVNPVKLYEYIFANKPVLAPTYEETFQFEPYVYLYSTNDEFCSLCNSVTVNYLPPKAQKNENLSFIQNNTYFIQCFILI